MHDRTLPLDLFIRDVLASPPARVHGTAVFMSSSPNGVPPALLHNLKHNKVLHDKLIFLSIGTEEQPYVSAGERTDVKKVAEGVFQISLRYGFMEDVDVPAALAAIQHDELRFKPMETSYFLGRETLIASNREGGMSVWREMLFGAMSRNARSAASFFRLPPNRVVELGAQIEL